MPKPKNTITQKQENFCLAYIETGNASEAYRRAYNATKMKPESIRVNAAKLLVDTNIALRVDQLRAIAAEKSGLIAADVLNEVKRLAFSDLRGIVHQDGRIKMPHELDTATAACISSFEIDERGGIKYKFWDKNAALEKAAKHLGLYKEDNTQKTDALATLLHGIASGNNSSFKPVQDDPEYKKRPGK